MNAQTQEVKQNLVLRPLSTYHQINLWRSQADNYAKEAGLNEEQANWIKAQRIYFLNTQDLNKQQLQETVNNIIQQGKNLVEEEKRIKAQTRVAQTEADVNVARQGLIEEQTRTQEYLTDQEATKSQIDEYHKRAVQTIVNEFGEIPLPTEEKEWLAAKLMSDDPNERDQAEKMLRGLESVAISAATSETNAQWQNYGKQWLMGLGNGVINAIPNTNVIVPIGKTPKKPASIGFH